MREADKVETPDDEGLLVPDDLPTSLSRLLAYWDALRVEANGVPSRERFDPLDLKGLWHGLSVFEFLDPGGDPDQTIVRYSGEWIDRFHGMSLVGKSLQEVLNETEYRRFVPCLWRAAAESRPHYRRGSRQRGDAEIVSFERLFVPFANQARRSCFMVGVWHFPNRGSDAGHVETTLEGLHRITSR